MCRSSNSTRVSGEFFVHSSSQSSPYQNFKPTSDEDQLPSFNPESHAAKKERTRLRSAENAIHVIPVLLVLCAIVLWYLSHPDA